MFYRFVHLTSQTFQLALDLTLFTDIIVDACGSLAQLGER